MPLLHRTSCILSLLAEKKSWKKVTQAPQHPSAAGWRLTNEVSVAVEAPWGKVPLWGRVQIDSFCAVPPVQDATSQRPRGEGRETITTSFSRVVQVNATSTAAARAFFTPHAPPRPNRFWSDPKKHTWQGWQTDECSMQSQAETDTHSQVFLHVVSPHPLSFF